MEEALKSTLLNIAEKAFCATTYDRAVRDWKKIKHKIKHDDVIVIDEYLEQLGNPDISPSGYGKSNNSRYQKYCVQLKMYIEKYVEENCATKKSKKRG